MWSIVSDLLQRAQARFLKELFHTSRGGFVLKGGMALSTLFGPSRLTRDVDLDLPPLEKRTADSLHNQVMRALKQALRDTGLIDTRISEPGKAEISPKWKVSGAGPNGEPFQMKVEVSRRPAPPGRVRQATVSGVSAYGLGTYFVDLYDERTLVAMKLAALLGRTAVRDVCDLDLLLPTYIPGGKLIDWALQHAGVSPFAASNAVKEKLASMHWSLFETQMLADSALMSRMDAASWQQMRVRVGKSLISILDTHALQGAGP
jgi:predicted nucleotidyltransferase component of viral defense system